MLILTLNTKNTADYQKILISAAVLDLAKVNI